MAYPVAIILRRRRSRTEPDRKLRSIQCTIIFLLTCGYEREAIAVNLGLKQQVIKNHIKEIYQNTGCSARTQLVVFGFFAGLLRFEEGKLVMVEMKEKVVVGWKLEWKE